MANEITIGPLEIKIENGNARYERRLDQLQADQSNAGGNGGIIATSTTEEALALGDVTAGTAGVMFARNLDDTDNIHIGVKPSATFYELVTLKPGEWALFRLNQTNAPYVQASANTPSLEFYIARD